MFASMWSKDLPFAPNWITNSRIVRAVADAPEGPYRFAQDVLPPRDAAYWDGRMTHNPTIHKCGGTYLLFYIGTTFAREAPIPEQPQVSTEFWEEARGNLRIGLATSKSIEGPWTRLDEPILQPRPGKWDSVTVSNPAPCVLADGRVLLLYKSSQRHKNPTLRYGVALADSYDGEYRRLRDDPLPLAGSDRSYEDAYVWYEDGCFQMLFNDMSGHITGEDHAGAHALSCDGVDWALAPQPKAYSRTVLWADGTTTVQGSLERPQLLIVDGSPTHLFAATADGPGGYWNAGHTWNMVIPLRRGADRPQHTNEKAIV